MRSLLLLLAVAAVATAAPPAFTPDPTAAKAFPLKAQPILANACADCHARKSHDSPFKLHGSDAENPDRAAVAANLVAVAAYLDPAAPHKSPLLKYATTAHGKATEAPLKAGTPAANNLALWVRAACGPDAPPAPLIQAAAKVPAPLPEPAKLPPLKATPLPFAEPKKDAPAKLNPADPFDPAAFNKK
jgi:hypothetical protein